MPEIARLAQALSGKEDSGYDRVVGTCRQQALRAIANCRVTALRIGLTGELCSIHAAGGYGAKPRINLEHSHRVTFIVW